MSRYNPYDPMLPGGSDTCRCTVCGLYFRRTSTFDAHRIGRPGTPARRCLSPDELVARGWSRDSQGYWRRPGPDTPFRQLRTAETAEISTDPLTHYGPEVIAARSAYGEVLSAYTSLEAEIGALLHPDWCPSCTKPYSECRCNWVAW